MHAKFSSPSRAESQRVPPPSDPHRLQFRAASPGTKLGAVDAANGTIAGVSIITANREAAGWGMWVDEKTVSGFHALLSGRRLKAYATHGSWGKDGTLDEIGYWDAPVIDGLHLRQNFTALAAWKKHHADEYDTLFELAEKLPGEFGASISFRFALAWVMGDGSELPTVRKWRYLPDEGYEEYFDPAMPVGALRTSPSVRPLEVYSADFVDQPAANDGLFRAAPQSAPVDAPANVISPAMNIQDINARFGAKPAHVARAVALLSVNAKLTLDEVAAKIEGEDNTAEFKRLQEENTRLVEGAQNHAAALKAKDGEIEKLKSDLAALQKGGTSPVPLGNNGGEGGAGGTVASQIAALQAKLDSTPKTDGEARGKLAMQIKKLREKE